jgi:hypothetical protein
LSSAFKMIASLACTSTLAPFCFLHLKAEDKEILALQIVCLTAKIRSGSFAKTF